MRAFGATGSIALIGYLFDAATVTGRPEAIAGFARASKAAKELLANDPSAWDVVRPLMSAEDEPTFEALKRDFLAGIPRRPLATERGDGETPVRASWPGSAASASSGRARPCRRASTSTAPPWLRRRRAAHAPSARLP